MADYPDATKPKGRIDFSSLLPLIQSEDSDYGIRPDPIDDILTTVEIEDHIRLPRTNRDQDILSARMLIQKIGEKLVSGQIAAGRTIKSPSQIRALMLEIPQVAEFLKENQLEIGDDILAVIITNLILKHEVGYVVNTDTGEEITIDLVDSSTMISTNLRRALPFEL